MIEVLINNETGFQCDEAQLRKVVTAILADHDIADAEVSLAIIDDSTMHVLNRDHLQHDYPTDVLSFLLELTDGYLDGEVVVSHETAATVAPEYDWPAESELLLYFVHGTLHLVGYDDHSDDDRRAMRERESHYLRLVGVEPPSGHHSRVLQQGEASA